MSRRERGMLGAGLVMILPWICGFLLFTAIPMAVALQMSFTNYSFLTPSRFIGFDNYIEMFTGDPLIWKSLGITVLYAVCTVPLQLIFGFLLANLLNQKLRGILIFRIIFYIPCLIVVVSATLLWRQMLDTDFGIINFLIGKLGIGKIPWLSGTGTIIASMVMINLWQSGKMMLINLAGLQSIPTELYEAADMEGCGKLRQMFHITFPMMSPVLFMNLLMGIIGAFKSFTLFKILTDGGPDNASLVYMLYLYKNAFVNFKLGYANAMSVFLFVIVGALTLIIFKTSRKWVYYEGEA